MKIPNVSAAMAACVLKYRISKGLRAMLPSKNASKSIVDIYKMSLPWLLGQHLNK
jgi:hypothetical protein